MIENILEATGLRRFLITYFKNTMNWIKVIIQMVLKPTLMEKYCC